MKGRVSNDPSNNSNTLMSFALRPRAVAWRMYSERGMVERGLPRYSRMRSSGKATRPTPLNTMKSTQPGRLPFTIISAARFTLQQVSILQGAYVTRVLQGTDRISYGTAQRLPTTLAGEVSAAEPGQVTPPPPFFAEASVSRTCRIGHRAIA